jgi:hypothetical protein
MGSREQELQGETEGENKQKTHTNTQKRERKEGGESRNPRDDCLTRRAIERQQTHQDPSRRSMT